VVFCCNESEYFFSHTAQNLIDLYISMMPKPIEFHYKKYRILPDNKTVKFDYQIIFSNQEPLEFTETIRLPRASMKLCSKDMKPFLEALLIILGISYYKLYLPKKVILPFELSKEQAEFWNTVYRKGLGELLYRNKIDSKQLAKFQSSKVVVGPVSIETKDRGLLGIGGGKDSIVAAELLKEDGYDFSSFVVETQRKDLVVEKVMKEIGKQKMIVRRVLDPKIFEEHEGSFDGHIPISAIFAFIGLLTSAVYGYKYVMVGNEHSSNFGNIKHKGEIINHQWSKTAEFENLLQEYTCKFITADISYISVLRQFYEIRIAKMFATQKKYFKSFSSCNRSFRVHKERTGSLWCGECAKCAFTFLILSPFMPKKDLVEIFGKNLLNDKRLELMYRDILGFGKLKPFDCVGTFEESRVAFWMSAKKYKKDFIAKKFVQKIKDAKKSSKEVLSTVQAPTLPTKFRFLGIENICILGYGKEGKVTEAYLKKFHPKLDIGILDQAHDKNYLKGQGEFDLAVKTPGISKDKVTIPYVTATNLFFSKISNLTIGVTGSKGKSTTASLIYQMLKADNQKVRLLGNIGNPMLKVLNGKINPKEIFVIELSSYMLDDIEHSPNIAVLLNLFPEHMDYHGGVDAYYASKNRIFKYQKFGDVSIKFPFNEKIPVKDSEVSLIGAHNKKNIKAAISVARLLGISTASISNAIKGFKPLSHRLEVIGEFNQIRFIDDAISTTPESTIEAMKSIKNIKTIFLGGEDRGYDFKELEKQIRKAKIENIVLFPETGRRMLSSAKGLNVLKTKSMSEAVKFAYRFTPKGSVCLLSTASPSYSIWKDFEEKGDLFQKFVKKYAK